MANYIRCIHYSSYDGSKEGIVFTPKFDIDANLFIPDDCTVDNDFEIPDVFPINFPFEYNLQRQ